MPDNGQVERMNRTIKDATVKRYHYDSHDQLRTHLHLFVDAYNHARRLKTLRGLTPIEFILNAWTKEPNRFRIDPSHLIPGPYTATIPQGSGTSGATVEPADGAAAVAALNQQAGSNIFSIDATSHKITIASTSSDVVLDSTNAGYLGFTAGVSGTAAVAGSGDATRTSLSTQFNNLLTQIDQLASDSSYNGVNLLGGGGSNGLKIQFNENGKSNLQVQGVDFSSSGLGLSSDATGFQADSAVNAVLTKLDSASSTLRAQSGTFGSNLTVVQNRQDFTKQLINILGTGSANLTNADLNEEAANSQALSTRQSMGISALSLANSAQQGVLQLLR